MGGWETQGGICAPCPGHPAGHNEQVRLGQDATGEQVPAQLHSLLFQVGIAGGAAGPLQVDVDHLLHLRDIVRLKGDRACPKESRLQRIGWSLASGRDSAYTETASLFPTPRPTQKVPKPVVAAWKASAPHKLASRPSKTGGWENTPPTMYTSQPNPINSSTIPVMIHTAFIAYLLPAPAPDLLRARVLSRAVIRLRGP